MHVKKMWELTAWVEWVRDHPEITDLSLQRNAYGDIPLACGRCKKKVQDVEITRKKSRPLMAIYCSLCGWEGLRPLGKMKRE